MKKIFLLSAVVLLLALLRVDVHALDKECTQAEQVRLRGLASATQISYEFYEDKVENTYGFKVTISGFSPDFYIYNEENGTAFRYRGNSVVTNMAFAPGKTYQLPFRASDSGICNGYLILNKSISLPFYNEYYDDQLCVGHEEYELCKKFTYLTIPSYSEFQKRVKQYINNLKEEKPGEEIPETPTSEKKYGIT